MEKSEGLEGEDALRRETGDLDVTQKASMEQRPADNSTGPSGLVRSSYLLETRAPIATTRYLTSYYSSDAACVSGYRVTS